MKNSILVIGLGNDILFDDSVGLAAARALQQQIGSFADVIERPVEEVNLREITDGYETTVILSAVDMNLRPGSMVVFELEEPGDDQTPSWHSDHKPAREVIVMGIQTENSPWMHQAFSTTMASALPGYVEDVANLIKYRAENHAWPTDMLERLGRAETAFA